MTDRGHVPYALLGVLLLVASASLSASLQPAVVGQPDVDRELDRLAEESQTNLREASLTAAERAAAEPVVEPANTPAGSVLRENQSFEDALRLRIYRQVRNGLTQLNSTRGDLTVNASLPPLNTAEDLVEARERIDVARAGANDTKLRVTVSDITLRAHREGREVANRTVSPTVVVDSPVLVVHERVQTFDDTLDSGVLAGGLGRSLAARLYPIAWARGMAQYGGAPIQSVIANRHVSLATNDAVLSLQQDIFGTSDPVGERTHTAATAGTLIQDLAAGVDATELDFLDEARSAEQLGLGPEGDLSRYEPDPEHHSPADKRRVTIEETADTELVRFLRGDDSVLWGDSLPGVNEPHASGEHSHLQETFQEVYSEDVRIEPTVRKIESEQVAQNGTPSQDWSEVGETVRKQTTVSDREAEAGSVPEGWNRHDFYARTVTVTETTTQRWETPEGELKTTSHTVETRYTVELEVLGQHGNGPAPGSNVTSAYEPGGSPVDGQNLGDIPPKVKQLVEARGGPDTLAKAAVKGTIDTETEQLTGAVPPELDNWVFADLNDLRERIGTISYETTDGELATFATNPPEQLAILLEEQRDLLVDVPDQYESVAQRASIAAQIRYLDRVEMRLDQRAAERTETKGSLDSYMDAAPEELFARLQKGLKAERSVAEADDNVGVRVDARPSYLTRESVDDEIVPALPADRSEHPLVVRNRNFLAVPYGELSDSLLDTLFSQFSTDRTSLHAGADALKAVRQSAEEAGVPIDDDTTAGAGNQDGATGQLDSEEAELRETHDRLERSVEEGTQNVLDEVADLVGEYELGDETQRNNAVRTALSQWDGTAERAIALTEGNGKAAIMSEIDARWGAELDETQRERLRLELQWIIDETRADSSVRPAAEIVEDADQFAHQVVRNNTRELTEHAVDQISERTYTEHGAVFAQFPTGGPVAPPPLPWVMTVNFWHVEVAGEYPAFQVRAPHGAADRPGGDIVYVRDGSNVTVDLTGDGHPELLGSAPRVAFENSADIAVAVPSGPRGVGDVDGRRDEESPGWPDPGPDE